MNPPQRKEIDIIIKDAPLCLQPFIIDTLFTSFIPLRAWLRDFDTEGRLFFGNEMYDTFQYLISSSKIGWKDKAAVEQALRWICVRFPGIINESYFKNCPPLDHACYRGLFDHAHALLNVQDDIVIGGALDLLLQSVKTVPITEHLLLLDYERLMIRLLRRSGDFRCKKRGELCFKCPTIVGVYRCQFVTIRNASWTLLGICKHKRSPLIPAGVHYDIIKRIAYYMRRVHEEVVILDELRGHL